MLFIFSTPVWIRHLWQLKTVVLLHRCLICALLLTNYLPLIVGQLQNLSAFQLAMSSYWSDISFQTAKTKHSIKLGKNQLPVSAHRWQHGSQIVFATFIHWQFTKMLITQQPMNLVPWSLVACTLVTWNLVACYFGPAYTSFDCLVTWNLIVSLLFSSQMSVWSRHLCLVALAIWTYLVCRFQQGIQIWS